jgi:hypothetical protein
MTWQKERDDLIAQTKAFVESVTGRTPQAVLGHVFAKPAPTENPSLSPMPGRVPPTLPIGQVVAARSTETRSSEAANSTKADSTNVLPIETKPIEQDLPPVKASTPGNVREEIQTRVAAFRAHQHRFHRERDAYFHSVLTRARSGVEGGPDIPSP